MYMYKLLTYTCNEKMPCKLLYILVYSKARLGFFFQVKDPNEVLSSACVFGAIMFYMWLLDDRQVLSIHGKTYSRDTFLFICLTILLWSSSTLKKSQRSGVLSREQTDEWKVRSGTWTAIYACKCGWLYSSNEHICFGNTLCQVMSARYYQSIATIAQMQFHFYTLLNFFLCVEYRAGCRSRSYCTTTLRLKNSTTLSACWLRHMCGWQGKRLWTM